MRFLLLCIFSMNLSFVQAQELIVGTLNTESASDTQAFKVAETIRNTSLVDVWAFQEVSDLNALVEYTVAAGAVGQRKSFRYVISESGDNNAMHRRNDKLGFVYNSSRLRQVETVELHGIRSIPGIGRLGEAHCLCAFKTKTPA